MIYGTATPTTLNDDPLCNSRPYNLLQHSPHHHHHHHHFQNQLQFATPSFRAYHFQHVQYRRLVSKPLHRMTLRTNCKIYESAGGTCDNLGCESCDPAVPTDYIYVMKCGENGVVSDGGLQRYANIELNPFACVLNYGQGIIEGLKAYKKEDSSIILFRPEENGLRMRIGADRLCMPAPTIEQFVEAVKVTVLANKRWVPPQDKGFLNIRPLLMGTGPVLSLTPSPEFTFLIYVSPVENYSYKERSRSINLLVHSEIHRAVQGGAGNIKAIGNYSGILKAQAEAEASGFSDVLYLDSVHQRYIEEASTANIFIVKDKIISTPALGGTILPGVTRESIIEIARSQGLQVEERLVSIEELFEADEVFLTETGACLVPVGSITYKDKKVACGESGFGAVSQQLYLALSGLQKGLVEDLMGWTITLKEEGK